MDMTTQEKLDACDGFRMEGNSFFKEGQYHRASDRYRKALDGELASIRRIYELKERAFQALWAVFAAAMISLFGFVSRMMWGLYGDDIAAGLAHW